MLLCLLRFQPLRMTWQKAKRRAVFLPFLDLWNELGISVTPEYFVDGLHPNGVGYQRLFEKIDEFIKSLA